MGVSIGVITYSDKKILLVDDNHEFLEMVSEALTMEGFNDFLTADSGAEAIEACKKTNPDLIVLDIKLPDIDGYEVCRSIRCFSDVPIMFLSGLTDDEDRVRTFEVGGDDYLAKPFNIDEFMHRVKSNLRRLISLKELKRQIIVVGELEIFPNEYIVRKNGKEINLRTKEFLLMFFLENENIVLSKEQIGEAIWGKETFQGDDNAIMVHVSRLRDKLEDNTSQPKYIQTIKNAGYKFIGKKEYK